MIETSKRVLLLLLILLTLAWHLKIMHHVRKGWLGPSTALSDIESFYKAFEKSELRSKLFEHPPTGGLDIVVLTDDVTYFSLRREDYQLRPVTYTMLFAEKRSSQYCDNVSKFEKVLLLSRCVFKEEILNKVNSLSFREILTFDMQNKSYCFGELINECTAGK
jgi:hypothetical protein